MDSLLLASKRIEMLVYFLQALQVRTLFDSSRILLWLTKVVGLGMAFVLTSEKAATAVVYGSGYTYSYSKVMAWGRVSRLRPSPAFS